MKKKKLLSITFLFILSIFLQIESASLPKRITAYMWNGYDWAPAQTTVIKYDNEKNIIETKGFEIRESQIIPDKNEVFTYKNSSLVEKSFRKWNKNKWNDFDREISRYFLEGRKVEITTQNFEENEWKNYNKQIIYKSINDQIDSTITQFYSDGDFRNVLKMSLQYNKRGDTLLINKYKFTEKKWILINKFEYNYDNSKNLLNIENFGFSEFDSTYYKQSLTEFTYLDNSKINQKTEKKYFDAKYVNERQYKYEYNKDNSINQITYLNWKNGEWQKWISKVYQYVYDENLSELERAAEESQSKN